MAYTYKSQPIETGLGSIRFGAEVRVGERAGRKGGRTHHPREMIDKIRDSIQESERKPAFIHQSIGKFPQEGEYVC